MKVENSLIAPGSYDLRDPDDELLLCSPETIVKNFVFQNEIEFRSRF